MIMVMQQTKSRKPKVAVANPVRRQGTQRRTTNSMIATRSDGLQEA